LSSCFSTEVISTDGLLKIAHFPAQRQRFLTAFARIATEREAEWGALPDAGYELFDYKLFLQKKWAASNSTSTIGHLQVSLPSQLS
jgi:hypothetical protein